MPDKDTETLAERQRGDRDFPRPFGVELAEADRRRIMPEPTLAEAMEDCAARTLGALRLTRDLCWEAWEEHEAPRYWYRWRCACVVLAHLFPTEAES